MLFSALCVVSMDYNMDGQLWLPNIPLKAAVKREIENGTVCPIGVRTGVDLFSQENNIVVCSPFQRQFCMQVTTEPNSKSTWS